MNMSTVKQTVQSEEPAQNSIYLRTVVCGVYKAFIAVCSSRAMLYLKYSPDT